MLKIAAKMLQRPWLKFSANNNEKWSVAIFEYAEELQCGRHDQVAIEASPAEHWVFNDCVIAPLLSPNLSMLTVVPGLDSGKATIKVLSNDLTYVLVWTTLSRVSKNEFEKI